MQPNKQHGDPMTEPDPEGTRKGKPRKPLTPKELAIAGLLAEGHTVPEVAKRLVGLGHHMAVATVKSRIRDIASKVPNPYDLTPIEAIRLYIRSQRAA